MFNHSILVLICEDCATNKREVMTLDYLKGDYIQPPASQSSVAIYSARSMFNNYLIIGSKTSIYAYYYYPSANVFLALPNIIKSFYYQNEWV